MPIHLYSCRITHDEEILQENLKNKLDMERRAPASPSSADDIHDLLAAINKIEKRDRRQVPASRAGPTHHPRRIITEVLDSLASLCVSQEKHEVIATALRVNTQARSLELMVAANGDIPTVISSHLKEIWNLLRRISSLNNKLDTRGSHEGSPTQPLTDAEYETP
ncbi:hypothetical protein VTN00DRAFT_6473 [Thermoascus crustaceus]|uniref:uncharacterized protein n=1 Tax=Thermoascus crustaceus TaxID=5088 RepID=UPI003742C646